MTPSIPPIEKKRSNYMLDIYIFYDHLNSDKERTLTGYRYSGGKSKPQQVFHILVNDPLMWNPEKDGIMPLFLHSLDVAPGHETLAPIGLVYLIKYARKRGYPAILATGKSSTISEQEAENMLLAAGFRKLNHRRYWMNLA